MIHASTVSIVHDDPRIAGREAAEELVEALGSRPDFVLLFASAKYDPGPLLSGLHQQLGPGVRLAGCSSFAEIHGGGGGTESVVAMGMKLGGALRVETMAERIGTEGSRALGRTLGERAKAKEPSLVLVFPDGLAVNGTQLLLGLQDALGVSFPIVGGVAADLGDFSHTHQFHDNEAFSGGAVIAVFSGPLRLVTAARSGWIPVGAMRKATRVEDGNVCLEIDGRPALDLYEEYLGPRATQMPAVSVEFPIGMVGGIAGTQRPPDGEILLLRAIKGVDRERRAITFGGDLPEGAEIRMTTATKNDVITGADEATTAVREALPQASIALIFDCMARKVVLGPRYRDELTGTLSRLGKIPTIGFYTYGELSPVQGVTMHHDETFTIALLEG